MNKHEPIFRKETVFHPTAPEREIAAEFGLEFTNALAAYTDEIQKATRAATFDRTCELNKAAWQYQQDRYEIEFAKAAEITEKYGPNPFGDIPDAELTDRQKSVRRALGELLFEMRAYRAAQAALDEHRQRIEQLYEYGDVLRTQNVMIQGDDLLVITNDHSMGLRQTGSDYPRAEIKRTINKSLHEFCNETKCPKCGSGLSRADLKRRYFKGR